MSSDRVARSASASTGDVASVRRYRWVVLAAGFVGQASYSAVLVGPAAIAPVLQHAYRLSLPSLGLVLAAANAGSLLTLLPWGIVADRRGERLVLAVGLTATAGALVLAAYARTWTALLLALAVAGALGSGVNSASGRAVMGWFAATERGLALGIRQTAVPVGGAVAALVLPRIVHGSDARPAFLFLSAGCVATAGAGAASLREAPARQEARSRARSPLRDQRLWKLGGASTMLVLAQISLISFVPLFLHRHRGLSLAEAGGVLAVTQVLGAAGRIGAGWLSDRLRARVRLIRIVASSLVLALALTATLVDAPLPLLIPALVVAGALGLSWNGLAFTATVELAGSGRAGSAIGFQQTLLSMGASVAPIMFAAVVAAASWRLAFAVAAIGPALARGMLGPLVETGAGQPRPGPLQ
jgi:sugar phosphate permease